MGGERSSENLWCQRTSRTLANMLIFHQYLLNHVSSLFLCGSTKHSCRWMVIKTTDCFQFYLVYFQLVSLTLDGLTGAVQDRMRSEHKTGAYHMMFSINIWSVLWLAIGGCTCFIDIVFTMLKYIWQFSVCIWHVWQFSDWIWHIWQFSVWIWYIWQFSVWIGYISQLSVWIGYISQFSFWIVYIWQFSIWIGNIQQFSIWLGNIQQFSIWIGYTCIGVKESLCGWFVCWLVCGKNLRKKPTSTSLQGMHNNLVHVINVKFSWGGGGEDIANHLPW